MTGKLTLEKVSLASSRAVVGAKVGEVVGSLELEGPCSVVALGTWPERRYGYGGLSSSPR